MAAVGSAGSSRSASGCTSARGRTYASLVDHRRRARMPVPHGDGRGRGLRPDPSLRALALAMLVGACGTVLAVRWGAVPIGAIGIVGALLSPVLAGAPQTGTDDRAVVRRERRGASRCCSGSAGTGSALPPSSVAGPQWVCWLLDSGSTGRLAARADRVRRARRRRRDRVRAARSGGAPAALVGPPARAQRTHARARGMVRTRRGTGERALAEAWLCFLAVAHLGVGVRELPASSGSPRMSGCWCS